MRFNNMNESFPIYVTRKTASGQTMEYSQSAWLSIFSMWLISLNIIAWGIFGLVACVWVSLSVAF